MKFITVWCLVGQLSNFAVLASLLAFKSAGFLLNVFYTNLEGEQLVVCFPSVSIFPSSTATSTVLFWSPLVSLLTQTHHKMS